MLSLRKKQPALFDCPVPPPAHNIERAFARLFATQDGKRILAHLCSITFMRASGPDAGTDILRHNEGQRALMTQILRLIEQGK